ncbi:unnamed protein product [Cunninghamella echinulata]
MATQRIFSQKLLNKLTKPLVEADIKPQLIYNETKQKSFWRPAQVSRRVQNDLRKACLQQHIDPSTIGLPPKAPHKFKI